MQRAITRGSNSCKLAQLPVTIGERVLGLPKGRVMRGLGSPNTPLDVLEYELVQEQASALGRMGRALEAALAKLRAFDAAHSRSDAPESDREARRALVIAAGKALWMFVVQREACGLRDSRTVMRDYDVPGEVMLCSGCPEPDALLSRRGRRGGHRQIAPRVG
jgi:hypothetical protein